ncbi:Poly [ADP-ribose] polymerase 3 [Sarracenia purpurea var. burkii]
MDMFCRERSIPVVSEAWLIDSIEKREAQPLAFYDISSELVEEGRVVLSIKLDEPNEELANLIIPVRFILSYDLTGGFAGRTDAYPEETLEERENVDGAVKEFAKLFEELTGNEFEPWEREK